MSDDDNYNFNNDIIKEEQTENDTEEHDPYAEILKNIT